MPQPVPTYSYYQSNVDPRLVEAQAKVFAHLGIPLVQQRDDTVDHAGWLTRVMRDDGAGDLAVVADIDAFPITLSGYERLTAAAQAGNLAGVAHVANHKNPDHVCAGPMFMAVRRDIYRRLGSPDMARTDRSDVGQILTLKAEAAGVPVHLVWPKFAIQPRWGFGQHGVFGIGTFYGENELFHLFESRRRQSVELFMAVAGGVLAGRHDFDRYLAVSDIVAPKRKKFLGLF